MKFILTTLFVVSIAAAQTSYNVSLIGQMNKYGANPAANNYSEVWGWTDTVKNKEYAFIGTKFGTSIVDISVSPISEVSFLLGPTSNYNYHEFRTYKNYLYIGAEGSDTTRRAGIQIVDLSTLPDSASFKKVFSWIDTTSPSPLSTKKYNRAHTVSIDKHYLYVNGGDFGGTRIMDIADPLNPLQVGSYGKGSTPYVHDAYIRNDTLYAAAINAGRLDIVDFTVKGHYTQATPVKVISKTPTVPEARTHQVWLSDNGKYMFVATEVGGGYLHIYDISDRTNPIEIAQWVSHASKSIHNVFVKGDFLYIAYYSDGFRVLDVSNPAVPIEVAFYRTYPAAVTNPPLFSGAWGVYPYFPSGLVAVSDMNSGLYILDVQEKKGGRVKGIVTDASSGTELADVTVTVEAMGRKYITDMSGGYQYGSAEGAHTVSFSKSGYITKKETLTTTAGALNTANVLLSSAGGTGVVEQWNSTPSRYSVSQNYPNPFNPSTTILFDVKSGGHTALQVYNSIGQWVATLVDNELGAGSYSVNFDAKQLSSGVYFYRFTSGTYSDIKKMTVLQ